MAIVLTIIALQQGLFALGWWVAGARLGLSRRAATHWALAALSSAVALGLILQRGDWHPALTIVLANVLVMLTFLAMRRGVQVFLRLPTTDTEALLLMAAMTLVVAGYGLDAVFARLAVVGASALIAWTLLRCAVESYRALRRSGDRNAAHFVGGPIGLLGGVYLLRTAVALVRPELGAQPLDAHTGFNGAVVVAFLLVGLLLNMSLGYLVVNRLVRRLQRLSQRDPLTGLLNRRGLAPRLQHEAARWQRCGQPYALLAVDVDHFKAVNDQHGHAVGDAVLVALAGRLRALAREVDAVARLGGEEFCVLLPGCDAGGAAVAAQRLLDSVRQAPWPGLPQGLTVSVGVAVATPGDSCAQAALARADAALLQAKAAGRNRLVMAS